MPPPVTAASAAHTIRILAAVAIFGRLAGLQWLPPAPASAALLVALLAFDAWRRGGGTWAALHRRVGWYPVALGAILLLTLAVRLPALGSDLGHQPPDIDGHRLAASIRHFFVTGDIEYRTVEHYPGIVFWAMGASAFASFVLGLLSGSVRAIEYTTVEQFMLAGRAINVVFAAALVACVAAIARRLSGPPAAVAAALVVALAPLSIETTTDMRNDAGQVLLVVATVLAALVARDTAAGRGYSPVLMGQGVSSANVGQGFSPAGRQALLVAGACAGLATGVKYTSVFALAPVLLAAVAPSANGRARRITTALAAFAVTLAASNHFLWWDFPNFLRQLSDQVHITGAHHWAATDNPSAAHLQVLATAGPGWPLLVLAAGWGAWALGTGGPCAWLFWAFPLLYSWFTTQRPSQFPRWVFPLLPFVAVAGACGLAAVASALRNPRGSPAAPRAKRIAGAGAAVVALVALAPPIWGGVATLSRRTQPTTAVLLEGWLKEHVPPGQVVLLESRWLDLRDARFTVRRVPDLAWALGEGRRALSSADWLVVPDTHFATPGTAGLALLHAVAATPRAFGGHLGHDYRVYAVPKVAPVEAVDLRLDDSAAAPALGWEWDRTAGRGPGLELPDRSAIVYLQPLARADGVLEVDLAGAGAAGSPLPVVVTVDDRLVRMADAPVPEAGVRRLTGRAALPREGRSIAVRLDPVKRGTRMRVVAIRLAAPR